MTFLLESAPRLAIGIGLVFVGYSLGSKETEASPIAAIIVAVVIVTVGAITLVDTNSRRQRTSRTAIDRSVADEVGREVARARRTERPVALARYSLLTTSLADRIVSDKQLRVIQGALRTQDRAWLDCLDLFILMPESDRASAGAALSRLQAVFAPLKDVEPRLAIFPEDGSTVGGLMSALRMDSRAEVKQVRLPRLSAPIAFGDGATEVRSVTGVAEYSKNIQR